MDQAVRTPALMQVLFVHSSTCSTFTVLYRTCWLPPRQLPGPRSRATRPPPSGRSGRGRTGWTGRAGRGRWRCRRGRPAATPPPAPHPPRRTWWITACEGGKNSLQQTLPSAQVGGDRLLKARGADWLRFSNICATGGESDDPEFEPAAPSKPAVGRAKKGGASTVRKSTRKGKPTV